MSPEEAFLGIKPDISHLRIFGCPVYVHIPKDKRTKLEPSGKRGIFVGYSETSKAYRIYIPSQKQIEVSRDVTFEEDVAFRKSKGSCMEIDDETPQDMDVDHAPEIQRETTESDMSKDPIEPLDPTDGPRDIVVSRERPLWVRNTMQEAEQFAYPRGTFRESKRPQRFSGYVALMCNLIEIEPSSVEEAAKQQVWKDAMDEEYQSILKNNVWDIVPRPKGKSVVSSKWLYKIKHATDGSIEKYKARFVARGFSQEEGIDYEETFAPVAHYISIRTIIAIAATKGLKLHQMDVNTTFLNGVIEEVYIEQPEGFMIHGKVSCVQIEESPIWS